MQAGLAVKNAMTWLKNPNAKLKVYAPAKPMGVVTLGRNSGVAQLPFGRFDPIANMKQKDMFVSMYLKKEI